MREVLGLVLFRLELEHVNTTWCTVSITRHPTWISLSLYLSLSIYIYISIHAYIHIITIIIIHGFVQQR